MADDGRVDSIVAALQAGDPAGAERLCRAVLGHDRDSADVLLLLGLCLQRQDRDREALVPYRRQTGLQPGESMHWVNYATESRRAGVVEPALQAARRAVEPAPDDVHCLEERGLLRLQLNRPREAQLPLLHAAHLAPEFTSVRIHTAEASVACRDRRAEAALARMASACAGTATRAVPRASGTGTADFAADARSLGRRHRAPRQDHRRDLR